MDAANGQANDTVTAHQYRSEPALRAAVAQTLRAHGLVIDEQVASACGAADIVTRSRDVIWEVKLSLHRRALHQALGQLILYRHCLNPDARLIIVGYPTAESATLIPHIQALGIEVVCWRDEGGRMRDEEDETTAEAAQIVEIQPAADTPRSNVSDHHVQPLQPSALLAQSSVLSPVSSPLRWHVQACALARGVSSVRELSFRSRVARQSLHPIWSDRSRSVSLTMLGRLAQALAADPGSWFRWADGELCWNIQAQAVAQGMTLDQLSWTAELIPHALRPIWDGTQQFVFLTTLGKLAHVLQLDTGELFSWQRQD